MARNKRFEMVHSDGIIGFMEVWVDKETGVNYVTYKSGYAGGMTVLLGRDGKPVISPIQERKDNERKN